MAQNAMDLFTNSYLKSMKRPEFWNFNPDEVFGANMVHGSEKQNPNPMRDQSNAQYGPQGQLAAFGNVGKNNTSMASNTFARLIAPVTSSAAPYLGKSAFESMRDLFSSSVKAPTDVVGKLSEMGGGYGKLGAEMLGKEIPSGDAFAGIKDIMTKEANEGLKGAISGMGESATGELGFDPTGLAISALPTAVRLLGGGKTASNAVGAAGSVGLAAAQGGMNPISDVAALYSLYKLFKDLF